MQRISSLLLLTLPALALAGGAAKAQEVDLRYANNIDTSVVTDVTYTKDVALTGTVTLSGAIAVDSSAVAVNDVKQIQFGTIVAYREENELNGENGFVAAVFGPGYSESGLDPNDDRTDGVLQDRIRAGFFAPIINNIGDVAVDGAGNLGLNIAAGYHNMQMNSAALAVSSNADDDAEGGWAEASTTSLQALVGNRHAATPGEILNEDDPEEGGGSNNFRDRNTVTGLTVAGAGNIGVNLAAGAFNQQANLMTLAVASDSALAEANAGIIQAGFLNVTEQQDSQNRLADVTIGGTGNIGVNMAAGVGNQQVNALTIASSAASAPDSPGGGGDPS